MMAVSMICLPLMGCDINLVGKSTDKSPYTDPIVVDVYDAYSNYQGIQSGWFAEIVKKKFNMELNIIVPNVARGGDSIFDFRKDSGNVGDLIICSTENGTLQDLVDEGLIIDMTKYLKDKDIMKYNKAIRLLSDKLAQNGIYAIPSEISSLPATTPSEGLELTYGPYLRWDIYSSIGYPRISTLEDMLPVLVQMQKTIPYSDAGNPTYAFSFFKDWDVNMMTFAKQPACFYGYDEIGFVLAKADGSDYQNILDSGSIYMRVLNFYYNANQLGLVDPDSYVQNSGDVFKKYQDGAILYSPWPWFGQSAYNTTEHTGEGKGFMLAPIDDLQIYSYGCNPQGNLKKVIAIGSGAEDPERLADFIDWLYSPEGIQTACSPNGGTAGPRGLTWEMGDDGPYLTDFGIEAFLSNETQVPEGWGTGTWADGTTQLNFNPVSLNDLDPEGYPYNYTLWESVIEMKDSSLDLDWKAYMGADSTHQYLENHNQIIVAPGCDYVSPEASSEITTIRNLCRDVIRDYSWRMIFAKDDTEFYSLMKKMQKETKSLGYASVYAIDIQNAKDQAVARGEAAASSIQ